jgi:hypothetical protein
VLFLVAGCKAEPPVFGDVGTIPSGQGKYAAVASCGPAPGGTLPACPGVSCVDNATGQPDNKVVDLSACPTLDLIFIGGIIQAQVGQSDLALHLGSISGAARVEAVDERGRYEIIGYIGGGAPSEGCAAKLSGSVAELSLSACNLVSQTTEIRINSTSGTLTVDAVEARSFTTGSK